MTSPILAFLELPLPDGDEPIIIAVDQVESVAPAGYYNYGATGHMTHVGARVRTKSGAEHVTTKKPGEVRELIKRAAERTSQ